MAGTNVRVRVRSAVVVHVEQAIVGVIVIVAANVQARVRRTVEVPVIARRKPRKFLSIVSLWEEDLP